MKNSQIVFYSRYDINSLITNLYYVVLGFLVLVVFSMPMLSTQILRIALYGFILLNVGLFALTLKSGYNSNSDEYSKILIYISIFILFISILIFGSFDVPTISAVIGYLSSFFIAYYSTYISTTKKTVNFIAIVCITLSFIFIYLYFSPFAYRYTDINNEFKNYYNLNNGSLTLGFANPNTTASFLLPVYFTLLVLYRIYVTNKTKIILFALSIVILYFIYLTDSRSTLFVSILYLFLNIFNFKIKITKTLVRLIILSGLVFIFIYSIFYIHGFGENTTILGKPLYSGRQEYFVATFLDADEYWLLGDIGKYKFGNLLNGMLSLFASGGIINVILYVLFFSHNISRRYSKYNEVSYIALLALVMIYFQSYSEGNFMVSGAYFSTMLSMLYVLSNNKIVKVKVLSEKDTFFPS